VVGFEVVAQHTPLTVIKAPPLEEIFPPETAVAVVTEVMVTVVSVGINAAVVVNERSFPYAVPTLFVAYARTWYVVPEVNPVKLLTKVPLVVPSVECESVVEGFAVAPQHTPLTVIKAPPLEVIVPPETAVVRVIEVIAAVVSVGTVDVVENDRSFP
jgi:hypothetical protein